MSKNTSENRLSIANVLGFPTTREEVDVRLSANREVWRRFQDFPEDVKEQIYLFLEGRCGLRLLYDDYFQHILNAEEHPRRLEHLLSALLEQKVVIKHALPREGRQMADSGSLVILDIIVQLESGSIVTLEMQMVGYKFPGQRGSCYLSDMIMRQYNAVRGKQGQQFTYRDMKPVYLLVLMEKNIAAFQSDTNTYLHRGQITYDSGVQLESLENIFYISLDNYRRFSENKNITNEQDAWLTFLSYDTPEKILELVTKYPEFLSIYREMAEFRRKPEELIYMFSDALRILDRNTAMYMVDEMRETIEESKKTIAENNRIIEESARTIEENARIIEENNRTIEENARTIEEDARIIEENNRTIEEDARIIEENNRTIASQKIRIAELESLLAQSGISIAK